MHNDICHFSVGWAFEGFRGFFRRLCFLSFLFKF